VLNPITKNVRYLGLYFSFWLIIASIQVAVLYFLLSIELIPSTLDALVFNSSLALICIAIWPLVNYSSLDRAYLVNTLITHFAGASVLIGIAVAVTWKILQLIIDPNPIYDSFLQESILWRAALGAIFYLLIALNFYVLLYNEEFKTRSVNEADLKRSLKEAELNMLKSQLNPHFIFNSLNSISSLTLTKPEKAQEMVISLSEFLRYSINPNQDKLIPLRTELAAVERFMEIEKVRFGDRLQVEIDCSENCNNQLVPPLIIQPLVENAIKFGVHETIERGSISINCSNCESMLKVTVKNSFDAKGVPSVKTGIGLKNVANRLHLLYGAKELMKIEKENSIFTVTLTLPQS
jgi:sensor histidine kinase YesM